MDIETRFEDAFFVGVTKGLCVGTFAHEQGERADDDGFTRTGFAGKDSKALLERNIEFADDGEISDMQMS